MKLHLIVLIVLVLLPFHFYGQSKISGTVYDEKSKQPIEFASVYIDGSTNGTMSDASGSFHLDKVRLPCTLVVSHLTYYTKSTLLKDSIPSPLNIFLGAREIKIQEVKVTDKNLREQNLQNFRTQFLGTDVWGEYAKIDNEEVLQFTKDYERVGRAIYNKILPEYIKTHDSIVWSADSTYVTYNAPYNLKATAIQPLKINLPLLGYTFNYDLVDFIWQYKSGINSDFCFNLGYSYFQQQPYHSKRDSIRIQNNRVKNYYNSAQHFRKSLYEKKLAQNGYKVYGKIQNDSKGKLTEVDLESCMKIEGNIGRLIGLKGIKLYIEYFKNLKGLPVDLSRKSRGISKIESVVLFINDTCIIRNTGSVPDNSIVFGPEIGLKKFGSLLPEDYVPAK
jgi:hypothetical protein